MSVYLKNARLFDTYQHKFLIFRIVKLIMRESGVFLLSILFFLPSRLFENLSLDVIGCALFYFSLVIAWWHDFSDYCDKSQSVFYSISHFAIIRVFVYQKYTFVIITIYE